MKKVIFEIKMTKHCFPLFIGVAWRGKAEAEAARRGEARRRRRGGRAGVRARAAPRRARAAGIHDAFLRPHANFQFFK